MTSTHWMPADFITPEEWPDNPRPDPASAVDLLMSDKDDAGWHAWDELQSEGLLVVTLNGFIEATEDPGENHGMDGYEPGQSYFKPTGEKMHVRLTVKAELCP
jgi:hypothetical protein